MRALKAVSAKYNFLTGAAEGLPACPTYQLFLDFNCFAVDLNFCGSDQTQKSSGWCKWFCGNDPFSPPCSGHGVCYYVAPSTDIACACDAGYIDGSTALTCVAQGPYIPARLSSFSDAVDVFRSAYSAPNGSVFLSPPSPTASWGAAFIQQPITLFLSTSRKTPCDQPIAFSVDFAFRMTPACAGSSTAGEGLAFVVTAAAPQGAATGVGLGGVGKRSVAVEFDSVLSVKHSDPNDNHVGVNVGGSPVSLASATAPLILNDAHTKHAWIHYDPTSGDTLRVFLSASRQQPSKAVVTARVSLCSALKPTIGDSSFLFGFVAASLKSAQGHDVLWWKVATGSAFGMVASAEEVAAGGEGESVPVSFHYSSLSFLPTTDSLPMWKLPAFVTWMRDMATWPVKNQHGCAWGLWHGGCGMGGVAWGVWHGGCGMGGVAWGVWHGGWGMGGVAWGVWHGGCGMGGGAWGVGHGGWGMGGGPWGVGHGGWAMGGGPWGVGHGGWAIGGGPWGVGHGGWAMGGGPLGVGHGGWAMGGGPLGVGHWGWAIGADSSAYAVVAAVEAAYSIASNGSQPPRLSVEQLRVAVSANCDDMPPRDVLAFLVAATRKGGGLVDDAAAAAASPNSMASAGRRERLAAKPKHHGIQGFEETSFGGWLGLLLAVQRQPVVVRIEASAPSFLDYDGALALDVVCMLMFWLSSFSHLHVLCGVCTAATADPCGSKSVMLAGSPGGAGSNAFNPCGQFKCSKAGASNRCACAAPHFVQASHPDGSNTCAYGDSKGRYTVRGSNVWCSHVLPVFGLTLDQLKQHNKKLSCSKPIPLGFKLTVTPPQLLPTCSLIYTTHLGDSCPSIAELFHLSEKCPVEGEACREALVGLNPGLDCSALTGRQAVCVERDESKAGMVAVCDEHYVMATSGGCDAARMAVDPTLSPLEFYRLNPGINCNNRLPTATFEGSSQRMVCIRSSIRFKMGTCPGGTYNISAGDSCKKIDVLRL
ncbi:unnamed protein product [Closterium sp. NIES-65]|nr:unnamed protein product [Closterium sp. NIES-65]